MKLTKCLQDGDAVRGGVHGIQTGGRLCHSTADGDRTGTPTPIVHLMMISITEIHKWIDIQHYVIH